MSNTEPSDTIQPSNKNKPFSDQDQKKNEVTNSRMAVLPIPEPTNRAHPFSGSGREMPPGNFSCLGAQTDVCVHPTNDTSSAISHHVPNHIRTNLAAAPPTPTGSTAQQGCSTMGLPSATSTTESDTSQILMDVKQPSALDESIEVMSIGDHGNESDCNIPSGAPDSGRTERTVDDQSVSSSNGGSRKRRDKSRGDQTAGRWTPEEHQDFLEGLKIFGREWKKVAERIPTRTSAQIRSHAQKYFAKLARDESTILHDQATAAAMVASRQQPSIEHEVVPQKATVLSESVQRNVKRILADPSSLEKEVEDTLNALRERYKQLQIRLEEANRRRHSGRTQSPQRSHVVENEDNHLPDIPRQPRPILDSRKRTFEEWTDRPAQRHSYEDMSSVSSACFSPTRELVDEELIALSVLGGSLSRSTSQQELPQAASSDESSREDALRQAQNASPTSSIGSHRAREDDLDDRSDQAKKLKLSDEETETTTNE
ncbi:hypothetical protein MHU86_22611 [Fragilaria crotonensis]|nr:hypothetical protein MHU86_22611 [Fragilaria crotonensis]